MNKKRLLKVVIDNKLGKELAQLLYDTKKEVFDEVRIMVKDCIKKGLATEFILLQGIPKIEKRHLSTFENKRDIIIV